MGLSADELDIRIDGLGSAGDGVGRLADGRVVFVARALPGDHVRVRLTHRKKQVQYAELVRILAPSPDRVEPRCRVQECGGCGLKELSLPGQGELKRGRVVETLRRIGGLDVADIMGPVRQRGDGWRWRHRVRLHASWTGGRWRLGYFARHSRELVELDRCPVLWTELEQSALELGQALESLPEQARLEQVELAYSRRDGRAAARLHGAGPLEAYKRWLSDPSETGVAGVIVESQGKSFGTGNLELRYDHRRASEFDLRFEPGVFTQANPELNDELVDAVIEAVRPAQGMRALELHAGIGNFSVPVRLAGIELTAVESNPRSAVLCRRNSRGAGVPVEVRTEADAEAVSSLAGFGAVLLDPPRTGARDAAAAIAPTPSVERVVYVSCDAATLARDAAMLVEAGFQVAAAQAFDLFPQTPHVEAMLVFAR